MDELIVLFGIIVSIFIVVLIILALSKYNVKNKKDGVVREEEVYYLRYPSRNVFRNFREKRVLRRLRRGGLTGNENCRMVCKLCMNRGYDFCNDPDKVQGCDCETNRRLFS